jgi:hypothetical protein
MKNCITTLALFGIFLVQAGCAQMEESIDDDTESLTSEGAEPLTQEDEESATNKAFQCNWTDLNGGGYVCLDYDPQGYRAGATFAHPRGNWMDFELHCDNLVRFGSHGPFIPQAMETHTFVFQVGSQGSCSVYLYDRSAGGWGNSPLVTR